jgi:hypothetical protein
MKTFKTILTILILTLVFSTSTAQVTHGTKLIGTVSGDTGTIDPTNESNIKTAWEDFLNAANDSLEIDTMWIDTLASADAPGYKWFIFATNTDESETAAIALEVDINGDLFEQIINGDSRTITCKGCTSGCSPRKGLLGSWYCTSCSPSGDCVKTETVTTNANGILYW